MCSSWLLIETIRQTEEEGFINFWILRRKVSTVNPLNIVFWKFVVFVIFFFITMRFNMKFTNDKLYIFYMKDFEDMKLIQLNPFKLNNRLKQLQLLGIWLYLVKIAAKELCATPGRFAWWASVRTTKVFVVWIKKVCTVKCYTITLDLEFKRVALLENVR